MYLDDLGIPDKINPISGDWPDFFSREKKKAYYQELRTKVTEAYERTTVYPPKEKVFLAYQLSSFQETKVVIIGQDPYHGFNQANGLCFSVNQGVQSPPSLINIFKELETDLKIVRTETDLSGWAAQGILLLNRVLTVEAGRAYSHDKLGWQNFTLSTVCYLNNKSLPVVFVLWGRKAQELIAYIDLSKHFIIKSDHPSPLSANRGFFGSKPFSKINECLRLSGQAEIDFSR